jgi:hypothetical protein
MRMPGYLLSLLSLLPLRPLSQIRMCEEPLLSTMFSAKSSRSSRRVPRTVSSASADDDDIHLERLYPGKVLMLNRCQSSLPRETDDVEQRKVYSLWPEEGLEGAITRVKYASAAADMLVDVIWSACIPALSLAVGRRLWLLAVCDSHY